MEEADTSDFYIERNKTPFNYQEKCLSQILDMFRKGINPILNFDTGLGKTFTSLELIRRMKYEPSLQEEFKINKVLIVCKASNIKDPWIKDIDENLMSRLVYKGSQENRKTFRFINDEKHEQLNIQGYDILLVSYDILANDIEYISQTDFDLVIFDEIHNQFDDDRYTPNISKIVELNYRYAVALTATPMKNSVYEPYFLACFMKYKKGLINCRDLLLQERKDMIYGSYLSSKEENCFDKINHEELYEQFETDLMYRLKKEFSEYFITVSKYHISEESPLPPIHSYRIILPVEDCIRNAVGEEVLEEENFFTKKEHLLTFPENYPQEMKINNISQGVISSKYIAVEEIVKKILAKQEKVIIFSQYVQDLEYLCGKLAMMKPIVITGKHNQKEREDRIRFFNSPNNARNLLLLSLNAFAEGINLQSANNVIFMNPWYNPSKISQAKDRVYRTGQKNEVNVFYFCTDTPLEERVWEIQEKKNSRITFLFFEDVKEKLPVIEDVDYRNYNYKKSNDFEQNVYNFLSQFLSNIS